MTSSSAAPAWRVELSEDACRLVVSLPHLETAAEVSVELSAASGLVRVTGPGDSAQEEEAFALEIPLPPEADLGADQEGQPAPRWSKRARELALGFGRRQQQHNAHLLPDPKGHVPGFEEGPNGSRFRKNNWKAADISGTAAPGAGAAPCGDGAGHHEAVSGDRRRRPAPSTSGLPEPVSADQGEVVELGFGTPADQVADATTAAAQEEPAAAAAGAEDLAEAVGRQIMEDERERRQQPPPLQAAQQLMDERRLMTSSGEAIDLNALMKRLQESSLQPSGNTAVSVDPITGKAERCEIDVEAVDMASALMLGAACSVGDADKVRSLIEAKVNPDICDEVGVSPLEKACAGNQVGVAKLLLKGGAKAGGIASSSSTPLHRAVAGGYGPLVTLLLQYGADPKKKDTVGRRAEALASTGAMRQRLQQPGGVAPKPLGH